VCKWRRPRYSVRTHDSHASGGGMAASPGAEKSTHSSLRPSEARKVTRPSGLMTVVASLRSGWKRSLEQLCASRVSCCVAAHAGTAHLEALVQQQAHTVVCVDHRKRRDAARSHLQDLGHNFVRRQAQRLGLAYAAALRENLKINFGVYQAAHEELLAAFGPQEQLLGLPVAKVTHVLRVLCDCWCRRVFHRCRFYAKLFKPLQQRVWRPALHAPTLADGGMRDKRSLERANEMGSV